MYDQQKFQVIFQVNSQLTEKSKKINDDPCKIFPTNLENFPINLDLSLLAINTPDQITDFLMTNTNLIFITTNESALYEYNLVADENNTSNLQFKHIGEFDLK